MKTNILDIDRRKFMKKAGASLLAATVGSSLALSTLRARAAQSAVAQNKTNSGRNNSAKSSADAKRW